MAKIRNRRKRLFIDELQVRLLSINVAYFAAILSIFAVALFAPLVIQLVGSTEGPEWEQQLVAAQFLYLSNTIWLPLVLTFVALGAHSVLISHRIAGPLYRLRSLLRSVAEGNFVARAALRDKDYLKTDAKVVNDMIEKLGALIEDVDERAYELRKDRPAAQDRVRGRPDAGRADVPGGPSTRTPSRSMPRSAASRPARRT